MEILCFWPAAPGRFGLAPAYPHTPVSTSHTCLPLSGEALQTSPLWSTLFSSKDFLMSPYRRPQSLFWLQLSNVISNSLQLNLLCNSRLLLVPRGQVIRGLTELWVNLYANALELSTAISLITKCKLQLLMTELILLIAVCYFLMNIFNELNSCKKGCYKFKIPVKTCKKLFVWVKAFNLQCNSLNNNLSMIHYHALYLYWICHCAVIGTEWSKKSSAIRCLYEMFVQDILSKH